VKLKDGEIAMTNQWECPCCAFPENFMPNCAACGYYNPEAQPEDDKQRQKFSREREGEP